jgi:hypothetical protein
MEAMKCSSVSSHGFNAVECNEDVDGGRMARLVARHAIDAIASNHPVKRT